MRRSRGQSHRRRNLIGAGPVQSGMGMDSVDRQTLIDADLDPDSPQVWAVRQRISDLLVCYGVMRTVSEHTDRSSCLNL